MHTSKIIIPNHQDSHYTDFEKGWLNSCEKDIKLILKGIRPYLKESSSEMVAKFTIGLGENNHRREAYYIGWVLVDHILKQGFSLEHIASLSEETLLPFVTQNLSLLIED